MNRTEVSIPTNRLTAQPAAPALPWRVAGAAVQGVSHVRLNLPCQDAQGSSLLPDGTLVIALADGAGSARFSDQGARCAVDEALRVLTEELANGAPGDEQGWEALLNDVFGAAHDMLVGLADISEEAQAAPRDFAATLTCAVVTADRLAVGQIGDGAVVAVDETGGLFAVTRLQRGEYANETHFITQTDALEQMTIDLVEGPVQAVAVMSDGLIRLALKLPAQEPHGPFFLPLLRFATAVTDPAEAEAQLSAFLASERVNARTDDDKSLVLAVREGTVITDLVVKAPQEVNRLPINRESSVLTGPETSTMTFMNSSEDESSLDVEGE